MSEQVRVEIFAVGNELLIGGVLDTNTHWLCKKITDLGGRVQRCVMLPDQESVIATEIGAALQRGVDLLLVTGGLGPTADDLTLAAVAQGAGLPLQRHEEARQMIKQSYDDLAAKGVIAQGGLNPPREKMALLPKGAMPLANPAGTAPGVLLQLEGSAIVCFPGVPPELKGIFETSLQQFLSDTFGQGLFLERALVVACNDESLLDPHFKRFSADFPHVYLKARSGIIQETPRLTICLSASGTDRTELQNLLDAAYSSLHTGLSQGGFTPEPA